MSKICTKCKEEKPLSEFYKDKSKKDGLKYYCKECDKKKVTDWQKKNPDRVKQLYSEYYERNRDKVDAKRAEWRDQNKEKVSQYVKKASRTYYHNNKQTHFALSAKRRAAKKQAIPPWAELDIIRQLYAKASEFGFEVDHVVPLQSDLVCGLHCWHNLQLLDPTLNRSKGNREWVDMP